MIKVIDVEYLDEYRLEIIFNNGEEYLVDLVDLIEKPAYHSLKNLSNFKQFGLIRGTLEWNDGLDIAPEYLYELSQVQAGVKAK